MSSLRTEIHSLLNQVQQITDGTNCSSEVMKGGIGHLKSAVAIMSALQDSPAIGHIDTIVPKEKIAPNTNNIIQPRFTSVKRKRSRSQLTSALTKPTTLQSDSCNAEMKDIEAEVCAICYKEDDKSNGQTVDWIQCIRCCIWIHQLCARKSGDLCKACMN